MASWNEIDKKKGLLGGDKEANWPYRNRQKEEQSLYVERDRERNSLYRKRGIVYIFRKRQREEQSLQKQIERGIVSIEIDRERNSL